MPIREELSPATLPVSLTEDGVEVEYADGRTVFYRGVPEKCDGDIATAPGKDVHVLVTDESESEGVLTYINDRTTYDEILEDTGVGRVLLDVDEETTVFPGVTVRNTQHRVEVEVEQHVDGRVFVFEEDELGERSYEVVTDA